MFNLYQLCKLISCGTEPNYKVLIGLHLKIQMFLTTLLEFLLECSYFIKDVRVCTNNSTLFSTCNADKAVRYFLPNLQRIWFSDIVAACEVCGSK